MNAALNLASLKKGLRSNARVAELRYPGLNHALQFASETPAKAASSPFNPDTPTDIYKWIIGRK
ncbi:hypothetical protein [Hymenobacter terricola]|uniref:hypothetical protein n=1 Tax=Hymenobacter terricola TaxID=2819236 RepID=UPI001B306B9F|nr:hypothetical protein [Hymenobacter terricola]